MNRLQTGWYTGKYKGTPSERCYGILNAGYWYIGGPQEQPHSHDYWGLVWAGKYTFGIGKVTATETIDLSPLTDTELYKQLSDRGE